MGLFTMINKRMNKISLIVYVHDTSNIYLYSCGGDTLPYNYAELLHCTILKTRSVFSSLIQATIQTLLVKFKPKRVYNGQWPGHEIQMSKYFSSQWWTVSSSFNRSVIGFIQWIVTLLILAMHLRAVDTIGSYSK